MQDLIAGGVRPPGAAGFFYPSSPAKLSSVVRGFIDESRAAKNDAHEPASAGPVVRAPRALVAPHAGYDYSGAVAGDAYATVVGYNFDAIIVLAPSHLEAFRGGSVFPGAAYRTPLGDCPVASDFANLLLSRAAGTLQASLNGHWLPGQQRQEHSLEVQLPFLQEVMKGEPRVVPLVIGDQEWKTVEGLGQAIAGVIEDTLDPDKILIVASSDLSHFHGDSYAEELDSHTLNLVESFDAKALHEGLRKGRAEACGGSAIAAAMLAARALGASEATMLSYTHSGKVLGDNRSVVGYGAVRID